ncbi:peptide-methionine (S)-S-oxide reductase MsrA [Euryhalocaulis caribicus]|uniref:peptide-methionine (S)-S-oxide reductase MsrA n=1 Tax=Euryhalocaulis caribicus TaxID=1161401 RepID=UPI0003A92DF8|nr:peptide-methionine (S)-S-oxide reductase MsrA [Euryhalocaulis caribicus]
MLPIIFAAAALAGSAQTAGADRSADAQATAYFASGCFWCAEADFEKVEGVSEAISGFTGGDVANPSYKEVTGGDTGHYEAIKVLYDPQTVSYDELLHHYWRNVDPLDAGGQFCDRGESYRSAIFVTDDAERSAAQASKNETEQALGKEVVTPILTAGEFYPAEDYHQDYYKSDDRILSRFGYVTKQYAYDGYREGCGRDARLMEIWGDEALGFNAKDKSS